VCYQIIFLGKVIFDGFGTVGPLDAFEMVNEQRAACSLLLQAL
jgi:hypothetical protein